MGQASSRCYGVFTGDFERSGSASWDIAVVWAHTFFPPSHQMPLGILRFYFLLFYERSANTSLIMDNGNLPKIPPRVSGGCTINKSNRYKMNRYLHCSLEVKRCFSGETRDSPRAWECQIIYNLKSLRLHILLSKKLNTYIRWKMGKHRPRHMLQVTETVTSRSVSICENNVVPLR